MSGAEVQGIFVWHEWMGRDPSAVASFYGRVLGWTAQAWERDPSYTVWTTSRGVAGGAARLTPDAASRGMSSGWLAYVAVADVEAAAATAERLGGRVVKSVAALPDGGRYAVVADPHSALIGIFAPPSTGGGAGDSDFVWHELATVDHPAAFRFYQELFGWERLGDHDLGAMGNYLIFGRHGRQLGGLYNRPSGSAGTPHWLAYVTVPNVAQAAQSAVAAGGRVASAPHQVPGGSWVAHLVDPEGAAIAVHQARAAAAAPQPTVSGERAPRPAAKPKPTAAAPKPAPKPAPTPEPQARKPSPPKAPARKAAAKKPSAAVRKSASGRAAPVKKRKKRASASRKRGPAKKAGAKRASGRAKTAKKAAARRSAARAGARRKTAGRSARRAGGRARGKAATRRPVNRAARRKGKSARRRR
jgi:uncharacterized protein